MSSPPSLLLPSVACCLLLLLLLHRAGAAEITVGDAPFGWDTGTNYAAWAQKHSFTVGDVLVFQYVKSQHNVYEVTEAAFRTCDVAGGEAVLSNYTSGYDRVGLAHAKTYWFICDAPGHCLGGMKLAVNVSAGAGGGGGLIPSPTAPPPYAAAAPSTEVRRSWMPWAAVALAVINWAT